MTQGSSRRCAVPANNLGLTSRNLFEVKEILRLHPEKSELQDPAFERPHLSFWIPDCADHLAHDSHSIPGKKPVVLATFNVVQNSNASGRLGNSTNCFEAR